MLVLSRKIGEEIAIDPNVTIKVVSVGPHGVKIAVCSSDFPLARIASSSTDPDYDLEFDDFLRQLRNMNAVKGVAVEDEDLLNEWYCSEQFAKLLTDHFHRAKASAIQDDPMEQLCEILVS